MGLYFIDEYNSETLANTGGTGPHFHFELSNSPTATVKKDTEALLARIGGILKKRSHKLNFSLNNYEDPISTRKKDKSKIKKNQPLSHRIGGILKYLEGGPTKPAWAWNLTDEEYQDYLDGNTSSEHNVSATNKRGREIDKKKSAQVANAARQGLDKTAPILGATLAAPIVAPIAGQALGTMLANPVSTIGGIVLGEVAGKGVDKAVQTTTGDNSWGDMISRKLELRPDNVAGRFFADASNPGYAIGGWRGAKVGNIVEKTIVKKAAPYIIANKLNENIGKGVMQSRVQSIANQDHKIRIPNLNLENYPSYHYQRLKNGGWDIFNVSQHLRKERTVTELGNTEEMMQDLISGKSSPILDQLVKDVDDTYKRFGKALNPKIATYQLLSNHQWYPANYNLGHNIWIEDKTFPLRYQEAINKYGKTAAKNAIVSHEVDHAVHIPTEQLTEQIFNPKGFNLYKEFTKHNNTEAAARGSQVLDYFGITDINKDPLTGNMLKHASKHYVQDTGINNNMTEFFDSIKDFDKMADWINRNSSIVALPLVIGGYGVSKIKN